LRFALFETLREYGAEQLTPEEQEFLARRHALYFQALAEHAEPQLWGPAQSEWLDRLEQEGDNFRQAVAWSLRSGNAEVGLRISAALGGFWSVRGDLGEWRTRVAQLLSLPAAPEPSAVRAR